MGRGVAVVVFLCLSNCGLGLVVKQTSMMDKSTVGAGLSLFERFTAAFTPVSEERPFEDPDVVVARLAREKQEAIAAKEAAKQAHEAEAAELAANLARKAEQEAAKVQEAEDELFKNRKAAMHVEELASKARQEAAAAR